MTRIQIDLPPKPPLLWKTDYPEPVSQQVPQQVNITPIKKHQVRRSNHYEFVPSDRIQLISQANTLVQSIMQKQVWPMIGSATLVAETELSEVERDAFNSALHFLESEFTRGASEFRVVQKICETDETVEFG